jgi:hypothetical protein
MDRYRTGADLVLALQAVRGERFSGQAQRERNGSRVPSQPQTPPQVSAHAGREPLPSSGGKEPHADDVPILAPATPLVRESSWDVVIPPFRSWDAQNAPATPLNPPASGGEPDSLFTSEEPDSLSVSGGKPNSLSASEVTCRNEYDEVHNPESVLLDEHSRILEETILPPPSPTRRIEVRLEPETLAITPGQPAEVKATVINHGNTADRLAMTVAGVPAAWVQGLPDETMAVQLDAGAQESIILTVNVLQTTSDRAGEYLVSMHVSSQEQQMGTGSATMRWTVRPFAAVTMGLTPARAEGRGRALYTVTVRNDGNAPARYALAGVDSVRRLTYRFAQDTLSLEPGSATTIPLIVRASRRWLGREQEQWDFQVQCRAAGGEVAPTARAQFINRAWAPAWAPPLAVFVLIGCFLLSYFLVFRPLRPVSSSTAPHGSSVAATPAVALKTPVAATPKSLGTPGPRVLLTGTVAVPGTYCFDLDSGRASCASNQDDFFWEQVTFVQRYLVPESGAELGIWRAGTAPNYQDCATTPLSTAQLDGSDTASSQIPTGTYVCARTSAGRVAMFRIDQYGSTLTISYTTWEK